MLLRGSSKSLSSPGARIMSRGESFYIIEFFCSFLLIFAVVSVVLGPDQASIERYANIYRFQAMRGLAFLPVVPPCTVVPLLLLAPPLVSLSLVNSPSCGALSLLLLRVQTTPNCGCGGDHLCSTLGFRC